MRNVVGLIVARFVLLGCLVLGLEGMHQITWIWEQSMQEFFWDYPIPLQQSLGLVTFSSNLNLTCPFHSSVGVLITGVILDQTHSWSLVFIIAALVNIAGAIVWLLFATGNLVLQ
jgi:hypothetical protein